MGNTDTIKMLFTYLTASLLALGSIVLAYLAWSQPLDANNPRDLALIFGLLGTAFGASAGFLFNAESATRASRASEKAHEAGVYAGAATPAAIGSPNAFEDTFTGDPEDGDITATGTGTVIPPK